MRYRQILTKIVAAKQRMGATMKASAFALTEASTSPGRESNTRCWTRWTRRTSRARTPTTSPG